MKRRSFIKTTLILTVVSQFLSGKVLATTDYLSKLKSNFKHVYSNNALKGEFFHFLENVFQLFPEQEFHSLIEKVSTEKSSDEDIYMDVQEQMESLTSSLSIFTYDLPALMKQKDEMAKQTLELLGEGKSFDGYLEIGSSGRYLDYLEEKAEITGPRYYADGKEPGYAITEMIDRGQITIGAEYIPMADYATDYAAVIEKESLDLITVYIGFHHCPIPLRVAFISSVRDTLRKGGKLVLRDHDCHNEDQQTLVALAHDVFNMGTGESWSYNEAELRNFYSLEFIQGFVQDIGFRFEKQSLFQEGDPTKNALMLFTKV